MTGVSGGPMALAVMPAFSITCVLLMVGGVFKLRAPEAGRKSLVLAGASVPVFAVRVLGALEIALGIAAAVAPRPLPAALVAVAYGGFCGFGMRLLIVGKRQDCGCFGGVHARVGATHLILNAIACITASLTSIVHPPGLGWILSHPPLDSLVAGVGLAGASFAVYAVYTLFPNAWRSYQAP